MRRLKLPCDDITPIGLWGSDMFLIGVNNDQFEVLRLWNVQTEDVTPATLRDLHTESAAIPTSPSAGNAASGARSPAKGAPSAASPAPTTPASGASAPASLAPEPSETSFGRGSTPTGTVQEQDSLDRPRSGGETAIDLQPAFAAVSQTSPTATAPASSATGSGGGSGSSGGTGTRARNGAAGSSATSKGEGVDLKLEPSSGSAKGSKNTEEGRPTKPARESEAKGAAKDAGKESASNAGKLRMTVDGEHLYAEIKGGKIVLKDRTYDSLAHARDSIRRERNKVAVWEYFDEGVKAWRVLNRD